MFVNLTAMPLHNPHFIDYFSKKVESGEIDLQSKKKRKRNPPCRFIDEMASTYTQKKETKEQIKRRSKGKRVGR